MGKSIFDYKHVKGTTAICLLNTKTKKPCGRIIANWSNNPNGSVCTVAVTLNRYAPTARNEQDFVNAQGKAGGYGYDKLSAAIEQALRNADLLEKIKVRGGSGNQCQAFEESGFDYIEVC